MMKLMLDVWRLEGGGYGQTAGRGGTTEGGICYGIAPTQGNEYQYGVIVVASPTGIVRMYCICIRVHAYAYACVHA